MQRMEKRLAVLPAVLCLAASLRAEGPAPRMPGAAPGAAAQAEASTLPGAALAQPRLRLQAGAFSFTKVVNRIFTPDVGDPAFNRACFLFANPDAQEVAIRIFDIMGARVRRNVDIRVGDTQLCWDGRDDQGSVVKGGIYIYQLETAGTVRTGTVIVAK